MLLFNFLFLILLRPPRFTLFPYTTLFRSIRLALDGEPLTIYGDGRQIRDYVFVEDVARALLAVAMTRETSGGVRSEEHTSELQSHSDIVCRLLLEKKNSAMAKAGKGLLEV